MRGISCVAEELLVSQVGICATELVIIFERTLPEVWQDTRDCRSIHWEAFRRSSATEVPLCNNRVETYQSAAIMLARLRL